MLNKIINIKKKLLALNYGFAKVEILTLNYYIFMIDIIILTTKHKLYATIHNNEK